LAHYETKVAQNTRKLSDRLREVIDAWLDALQGLLSPPPAPVPVRVRYPRTATKRHH
jgi:hypothetical protein